MFGGGGVLVEGSVLEKDTKEGLRSIESPGRVPRQRRRGRTVLRKKLDQSEVQWNAESQITGNRWQESSKQGW